MMSYLNDQVEKDTKAIPDIGKYAVKILGS